MSKKVLIFFTILLIINGCLFLVSKNKAVQVSSGTVITNYSNLSNKKIKYGLKRAKDNNQPIIDSEALKILNKQNSITMGNKDEKIVYLTFDQGYEAGYTSKILDVLKENNVKASFFITGYYLNKEAELIKRMLEEGHIIGNHTVNHPSIPDVDEKTLKDEIQKLHTAMYEKTGCEMVYFRPPKGEFSEKSLAIVNSLGYTNVMWSFAYDDWDENKQKGEIYAKDKILSNIHPGAVILLHATSKDNAEVLDYCIKEIKNMGYEIKSLKEFKK